MARTIDWGFLEEKFGAVYADGSGRPPLTTRLMAGLAILKHTYKHSKGGQFVAHVQALPGNPYDGHTLAEVIPGIEKLVGTTIDRLHADAGYRGHNAPADYRFKIYTSKTKTPRDPGDQTRDAPPL